MGKVAAFKGRISFAALLLAAFVALASCGKDGKDAPTSREIMKKYTDTLSSAPQKARDASGAADERNKAQEEALKGL